MIKLNNEEVKAIIDIVNNAQKETPDESQDHREGPAYDYVMLQKELDEARAQVKTLNNKVAAIKAYNSQLACDKDDYSQFAADKTKQNQNLVNEIMELKTIVEDRNKSINMLEQMVRNQAKTIGDYQQAEEQKPQPSVIHNLLEAQVKDLTGKLNKATEYTTRLEGSVNELCESENDLMSENCTLRNRCALLRDTVSVLKTRLNTKDKSVEELKGQLTGLLHENQTMLSTINAVNQYQRLYKLSL